MKAGESGGGAVRQAFCAALQAELADFYRLVAVLEVQANQPLPKPGAPIPAGIVRLAHIDRHPLPTAERCRLLPRTGFEL